MSTKVYASGEAAALVGLPRWRLLYLVEKKLIPGPSFQVPGRRLFTDEDIEKIAEVLKKQPALKG